ncbi:MAG: hypothetical protein LUH43_00315 [Clostridia bacterium]|nr:hypothetical protein [Clostridia bacterium]
MKKSKVRCFLSLFALIMASMLISCASDGEMSADSDTESEGIALYAYTETNEAADGGTEDESSLPETEIVGAAADDTAYSIEGLWICDMTLGEVMDSEDYISDAVNMGVEGLYDEIDESIEFDTYLYFHDTGTYERLVSVEQYDAFVDEIMECLKSYLEECASEAEMTLDDFMAEVYAMEWSEFVDYTHTVSFSYDAVEVEGIQMIYTQSGTYTYEDGILTTSEEIFTGAGMTLQCDLYEDSLTLLVNSEQKEFTRE